MYNHSQSNAETKPPPRGVVGRILEEASNGLPIADLLRKHNISQGTYNRWKSSFNGMERTN